MGIATGTALLIGSALAAGSTIYSQRQAKKAQAKLPKPPSSVATGELLAKKTTSDLDEDDISKKTKTVKNSKLGTKQFQVKLKKGSTGLNASANGATKGGTSLNI